MVGGLWLARTVTQIRSFPLRPGSGLSVSPQTIHIRENFVTSPIGLHLVGCYLDKVVENIVLTAFFVSHQLEIGAESVVASRLNTLIIFLSNSAPPVKVKQPSDHSSELEENSCGT